jgi:hypothetical protein
MDIIDPQWLVRILCTGGAVACAAIGVQLLLVLRRARRSPPRSRFAAPLAWTLAGTTLSAAVCLLGYAWLPLAL